MGKKILKLIVYLCIFLICSEITIRLASYFLLRFNIGYFKNNTMEHIILCVGDSFTYGINVDMGQKYPKILEKKLNETNLTHKYKVINLGKPGASSGYVLASLQKWIKQFHPEIILILTGWNCNDHDFAKYSMKKKDTKEFKKIKFYLFINRCRVYRLIRYILAKFKNVSYESIYPEVISMRLYNFSDYQKICLENLMKICEIVKQHNIKTVLLNYPQTQPPANPYTNIEYYHYIFGNTRIKETDYLIKKRNGKNAVNSIIEFVAGSFSIPYINNADIFSKSRNKKLFIDGDHHPNAGGNDLMASSVYEKLIKEKFIK
ncbi:MAG: hypothetical protein JW983_02970 [Elusimicrobia bacterium]|nr:hypothetical protein [Elusimicrobiota bacterium]